MNSLKFHIQFQCGISVNSLYYKTVMDGGTPPGHMDARPTTIPPQYTKGELQTPTYLRERVGGVDNTWNIRLGDIVPLPPPYMYPPNMHITEILLGIVRGTLIEAPLRVISVMWHYYCAFGTICTPASGSDSGPQGLPFTNSFS